VGGACLLASLDLCGVCVPLPRASLIQTSVSTQLSTAQPNSASSLGCGDALMRASACAMQPLTKKVQLRVRDEAGGKWRTVAVPQSVRALVLLNIQVMVGGAGWSFH
jgi:membrane carboxypeptidase/penicillin-binding protein